MSSLTVEEVTALIAKLESLTKNPPSSILSNDSLRRKLREAGKDFSIAMEAPGDTVHRIGNTVNIAHNIAMDLLQNELTSIGIASVHGAGGVGYQDLQGPF
jgi:hypothetical protein